MRLRAPSGESNRCPGLSQKLADRRHHLLIQRPGESFRVGSIRVAQGGAPGLDGAVNRCRFAQVHPLDGAPGREDVRHVAGFAELLVRLRVSRIERAIDVELDQRRIRRDRGLNGGQRDWLCLSAELVTGAADLGFEPFDLSFEAS